MKMPRVSPPKDRVPKAPTLIGLSFALNNLRRALWEEALERAFDSRTRAPYWEEFRDTDGQVRCSYCGASDPKRWDHVVPITKGGATVCGNLIPSCGPCDDSKGNADLEAWLRRKRFPRARDADSILKAIENLRKRHRYDPRAAAHPLEIWPDEKREIAERLHALVEELGLVAVELRKK